MKSLATYLCQVLRQLVRQPKLLVKNRMSKKAVIRSEDFLAAHLVRLADKSYSMELERYNSLLSTSGRIITCSSILSVALIFLFPILQEHLSIRADALATMYLLVFALIAASFLLSLIAQYRFKYEVMLGPNTLAQHVIKEKKYFEAAMDTAEQYCGILETPYTSIRKRNDWLSRLLKVSTIMLCAVIVFVIIFCSGIVFHLSM